MFNEPGNNAYEKFGGTNIEYYGIFRLGKMFFPINPLETPKHRRHWIVHDRLGVGIRRIAHNDSNVE